MTANDGSDRARLGFLEECQLSNLTLSAKRHIGFSTVCAGLALVATLVYFGGGTHTALPHLFYVPILLGAYLWGRPGGIMVGLLAGITCGHWMPLDTLTGQSQALSAWAARLIAFLVIGGVSGTLFGRLRRSMMQMDRFSYEVVQAFVKTIDAKSAYTARHSADVAAYAVTIGRQLGLSNAHLRRLYWAGLLHDIGKLSVPESLLEKQGKLTDDEWRVLRGHPVESERIVEGVAMFQPCLPAIRHHHERVDGRGYPDGIRGEDLCLDARILSVADAFDAMISDRPYRRGVSTSDALAVLWEEAGTQFDSSVVAALITAVAGSRVHAGSPSRIIPAQMVVRRPFSEEEVGTCNGRRGGMNSLAPIKPTPHPRNPGAFIHDDHAGGRVWRYVGMER